MTIVLWYQLTTSSFFELNQPLESAIICEGHSPVQFDASTSFVQVYFDSLLFFFEDLKVNGKITPKSYGGYVHAVDSYTYIW